MGAEGREPKRATRVPGVQEARKRISRGGLCHRAISADTRITVAWLGRVDAGTTKCATDATVGGGMSEAPGIFTRSDWKGHRLMCPILRLSTKSPTHMGRP
jgi:hypothetical protein